jgi:hypothetical protein
MPDFSISYEEAYKICQAADSINRNCDGAKSRDDIGFDKPNSIFFKSIFYKFNSLEEMAENLSDNEISEMYKRLYRFRGQLKDNEFVYGDLMPECINATKKNGGL